MFETSAPSPDRPAAASGRLSTILFWVADQGLLLFDFTASVEPWVVQAGRRRFNFWPFLLLSCSTIGFAMSVPVLIINIFQELSPEGRSPGTIFPLSSEDRQWLIWMIISGIGRLAALNLGSPASAGAERVPAARSLTAGRVANVFGLAMLCCGAWLIGSWKHDASKTVTGLINFNRDMKWLILGVVLVSFLMVVWGFRYFWRALTGAPPAPGSVPRNKSLRRLASFSPVLAGVFLMLVAWGVASKHATDAREMARDMLQMELGDQLGRLVQNDAHINYTSFQFDYVPDAPRILVHYEGLTGVTGGGPGPLRGDLVLNFQSPDGWLVTGAGALAQINTSLHTAAPKFMWWSGSPAPPAAAQNPSSVPLLRVAAGTAQPGDLAVTLEALGLVDSSNTVVFSIAEDDCQQVIRKFDAHQPMPVEAEDRHGVRFGRGVLAGMDNQIDPATGTLKCRASLIPEGNNLMLPGLYLNVHLSLDVKPGVILVPAAAVQRDPDSAYVWVIQSNNTVTRRRVGIGTTNGKWTEIQSGLSSGEVVVGDHFNIMREGRKVVVAPGVH